MDLSISHESEVEATAFPFLFLEVFPALGVINSYGKTKIKAFSTPNLKGLLVLEQKKIEGSRSRMMQLILKTYYCMQEKLKRVEKNLKRYVSFESVLEGSEKN